MGGSQFAHPLSQSYVHHLHHRHHHFYTDVHQLQEGGGIQLLHVGSVCKFVLIQGFLMTSVLGKAQEGANLTTFRKVLSSFSLIAMILISTGLLMNIIFKGKTFI